MGNALPADIQTAAQKAILEKPETKAILEGKKDIEESKDEAKATCIIELLGVKNIERRRVTKSPRRQRKTTNPKSPAVLTSPTETKPQRNSTARKTTFRISKHGKPS